MVTATEAPQTGTSRQHENITTTVMLPATQLRFSNNNNNLYHHHHDNRSKTNYVRHDSEMTTPSATTATNILNGTSTNNRWCVMRNGGVGGVRCHDSVTQQCPLVNIDGSGSVGGKEVHPDRDMRDNKSLSSSSSSSEPSVSSSSSLSSSQRMKELLEGLHSNGDCGNPASPPPWLDRELFDRGRQFYHRYLFCVFFSDLLALLMMFSASRILRPLMYTGRSDTPLKALRRYVSTIMHVITWYTGDVWDTRDEAHRDIQRVRSLHVNLYKVMNSPNHQSQVDEVTVKVKGHHQEPNKCPLHPDLQRDLASQVKCPGAQTDPPDCPPTTYLSQWDMVFTQYNFMGIIVNHPQKVGAWWVTEGELEGLIHFWRGIGWLLGIEDRYNFCSGTLAETRALCTEMERQVIRPKLAAADWNYEHMCTSLIVGMNKMIVGLSLPAMLRFLADVLGLRVPSLVQRMNYWHTFQYWALRFFLHLLFIIPGVVYIFNELLKLALSLVQGQIPRWLRWLPKSVIPGTVTPYCYN